MGFFFLLALSVGPAWGRTQKAQEIYETHSPAIYQIRVIDIRSGEKSVIGSGFRISTKGEFATNYHVISEVVDKPEKFRIEYRNEQGDRGELKLLAVDAARDLALLKGKAGSRPFLTLGSSSLRKGDRVFPMGNPLDLGMTIVEGTYNGFVGPENYKDVLLSAPLNPGMSGGPAMDDSGEVIGINVSIEGNDLSNLVPVENLKKLIEDAPDQQKQGTWQEIIADQILRKSGYIIEQALQTKAKKEKFGSLIIPGNFLPENLKCWGNSDPEDPGENKFISYTRKFCQSKTVSFLLSDLYTADMEYSFLKMKSDSLDTLSFYQKYSSQYAIASRISFGSEQNFTEFQCANEFLELANRQWKSVYCVRQYKKFPKLYDVVFNLVVLGDAHEGHVVKVGLAGVNESLARAFLNKLLGGIEWAG